MINSTNSLHNGPTSDRSYVGVVLNVIGKIKSAPKIIINEYRKPNF